MSKVIIYVGSLILSLEFKRDCKDGDNTFERDQSIILEKAMATHSSILAWEIPWTEEPGRVQSMGLLRVRHD